MYCVMRILSASASLSGKASVNIVVIAISEITKSAFSEGMNIASARGSFRIAYNASKLLSIKARKDKDGGILDMIIKTEANREKENLRVMLKPDGVKLNKVQGGGNAD